jgi:hypothetical protein
VKRTASTIVFVAVAVVTASAQIAPLATSKTRGSPLDASRNQVVVQARLVAPFRAVSGPDSQA